MRLIVAVVPPQYLRVQPFATFIDALKAAGGALGLPELPSPPPFLTRVAREEQATVPASASS